MAAENSAQGCSPASGCYCFNEAAANGRGKRDRGRERIADVVRLQ